MRHWSEFEYHTDLLGAYQKKNTKTAFKAIQKLEVFDISEEHISNGLQNVVANTNFKGRWQILNLEPKVICDTAHNREGLEMVMHQLKHESFQRLHIVLGVVSDKNLETILPLFPKEATYYFCKPDVPRGLSAVLLQEKANCFNLIGDVCISVNEAYKAALKNASKKDVIYIGGSTFVVAEVV